MSLSEQERQKLREIEQSLLADDPKFGSTVHAGVRVGADPIINLRGIALIVVGILLILAGIALAQNSLWFVAISIAGFLLMLGAGIWMLRASGTSSDVSRPAAKPMRASQSSLAGRFEENFKRRFEQ